MGGGHTKLVSGFRADQTGFNALLFALLNVVLGPFGCMNMNYLAVPFPLRRQCNGKTEQAPRHNTHIPIVVWCVSSQLRASVTPAFAHPYLKLLLRGWCWSHPAR